MRFDDLDLSAQLLANVKQKGYETPSPIQAEAIPPVLAGRDVLGCAQTGTGKTAAFALPVLHNLTSGDRQGPKKTRCLVLCPTRELAVQIAEGFQGYSAGMNVSGALVFGGVGPNPQIAKLKRGAEVVVATPGRLLDLMNQGYVDLSDVETLILDEADRMLDMGFINDIKKIVKELPSKRQTLLFSATVPTEIRTLSRKLLHDPVTITIEPDAPAAEKVDQTVRFIPEGGSKADLLAALIQGDDAVVKKGEAGASGMHRAIVFTRTKHGADKLVKALKKHGIHSEAIHGNKSQNARQRALENFRGTKTPVLVATDVAARGIDVDGITHVVNFDLTHEPETYVHRIGRTARAGADGHAVSLCDREELAWLRDIEKLLGRKIPVEGDVPEWSTQRPGPPPKQGGQRGGGRGGGGQRGGGGSHGGRGPAARGSKSGGGGRRKRPGGGRGGGAGAGPKKGGRPGRGAG